jgi:hypothetical protein
MRRRRWRHVDFLRRTGSRKVGQDLGSGASHGGQDATAQRRESPRGLGRVSDDQETLKAPVADPHGRPRDQAILESQRAIGKGAAPRSCSTRTSPPKAACSGISPARISSSEAGGRHPSTARKTRGSGSATNTAPNSHDNAPAARVGTVTAASSSDGARMVDTDSAALVTSSSSASRLATGTSATEAAASAATARRRSSSLSVTPGPPKTTT